VLNKILFIINLLDFNLAFCLKKHIIIQRLEVLLFFKTLILFSNLDILDPVGQDCPNFEF